MSDAEHFLQDARKSFNLAAEAVGIGEIERHSAMGRDFLQLAHKAAKLVESDPANNSAVLRKKIKEDLADLKSLAIAELEHRGYEVRGKTTTQIKQILRRHPTKLPSVS